MNFYMNLFIILVTFENILLFLIWKQGDLLNFLFKIMFFLTMGWGLFFILVNVGFIVRI